MTAMAESNQSQLALRMPSATVPKYQDPKIQLLHSKQIQANPFRYVFSSHIACLIVCLIACLRACIGGAAYLANETKINIATYPRPRKQEEVAWNILYYFHV